MEKVCLTVAAVVLCTLAANKLGAQAPGFGWAAQTNNAADISNNLVAVDRQNGFVYAAGWFAGDAIDFGSGPMDNLNPSSGTNDIYVVKYTTSGTLVWAKSFGGFDDDELNGLAVDGNGNVFITGVYTSDTLWFNNGQMALNPYNSQNNFYLAKLDANGNTQWVKTGALGASSFISPSQTSTLAIDASNNVYITGSVSGSVTIGSDSVGTTVGGSMYAAKFDNDGNVTWVTQSQSLTTNLNPGDVIPEAITIDKDGNCIVAGAFADNNSFGSTVVDVSNDFYFDRFVTKIDKNNGSFIWAKGAGVWQGPDENFGVGADGNNNIYLTGQLTYPTMGWDNSDAINEYFIEKLNTDGDSLWINNSSFGTSLTQYYIATDDTGNSYIALDIADTSATFGNITVHIPVPNSFGVAGITLGIVKFDNAGNAIWVKTTQGQGTLPIAQAGGIALGNAGCLYAGGEASDTINFDSHQVIGDISTNDFFIAGLCNGVNGIQEPEVSALGFSVYPNPASLLLHVSLSVNAQHAMVEIYSPEGRLVQQNQIGNSADIPVESLAAGIYIVKVTAAETSGYCKIMKQ